MLYICLNVCVCMCVYIYIYIYIYYYIDREVQTIHLPSVIRVGIIMELEMYVLWKEAYFLNLNLSITIVSCWTGNVTPT